jgi:nickel-dependent lactate racemase|tara:strand:+ start:2799 stop:4127 length:1329 start_codon:yes stop_codon:yes gene_type:complete
MSLALRFGSGDLSTEKETPPFPSTTHNYLTIKIPWKCWYGNEMFNLTFPTNWNIKNISMNDADPISDETIRSKILNPISSLQLNKLVKGKSKPVIVIDDIHRPTESYRIIPILLREMMDAGIETDQIDVLVSLGMHRPMSGEELKKKIGKDMVNTLKVYNHNPYENLQLVGKTSLGRPLYLNRFLVESDFKIIVGSVIPHPYSGFGGGAKLVLPGLAGIDTIEQNHKPAYKGEPGTIGVEEGNKRRAEMENAARMVGIDFAVNTVCTSEGKTSGIFAGGLAESYHEAVKYAQQVYATDVQYNLDVGIFNAFPKDNGVVQSFNALNVWSTRNKNKQVVKLGGTIIICSSCPDGVGYHGLTDRGMRLYIRRDKHGSFKHIFTDRNIIFFSPTLIPRDIHDFLPKTTILYRKWSLLIEELKNRYPQKIDVGVFPCGPLQINNQVL